MAREEDFLQTVEADDAGARLDKWLAEAWPEISRSRLAALVRDGHVRIDGATIAEPSRRVKPGERVALDIPPPEDPEPRGQDIPLSVIYEDSALIVIDKPAGLVVHPAAGNPEDTLVNALIAHCGDSLSGIGGVRRPGIVHRLDKDTSGLLVAAKTDQAHAALSAQFAAHSVERAYRALVWGTPKSPEGRIETQQGRSPTNRKKMAVLKHGGRHAITNWRRQEVFGPEDRPTASLVECRLETGRTHQIRVHMAHLGCPVVGDPVYGRGQASKARRLPATAEALVQGLTRQLLHAWLLGFEHPVSGAQVRFESPLPADFEAVLSALREG